MTPEDEPPPVSATGSSPAPSPTPAPPSQGEPPSGSSPPHMDEEIINRWRLSRSAVIELLVLLALTAVSTSIGAAVAAEIRDVSDECPSIVRFELAVPAADLPQPAPSGLTAIEDIVTCGPADELGQALQDSVILDLIYIVSYAALLLWVTARMGGFRVEPLAQIDHSERGRQVAHVAQWCVVVAAVCDMVENIGLWMTGDDLPGIHDNVVRVTAGASAAKWVLLALPITVAAMYVVRLAYAAVRSQDADRIERAVILPRAHIPDEDQHVQRSERDNYRWSLPAFYPVGYTDRDDHPLLPTCQIATSPVDEEGKVVDDRYGVCLSGGGIRSATFALGAIQSLEGATDEDAPWAIQRARYLSAVSGGSYMAASYQFLTRRGAGAPDGMDKEDGLYAPTRLQRTVASLPTKGALAPFSKAVANVADLCTIGPAVVEVTSADAPVAQTAPATPEPGPAGSSVGAPPPPSPPSPEPPSEPPRDEVDPPTPPLIPKAGVVEDHFRRSATHLADGAAEWILAIGEVVLRSLSSVLVLILGVVIVSLPLGWMFRSVYHGLSDTNPAPALGLRIATGPLLVLGLFLLLRWLVAPVLDQIDRRRHPDHALVRRFADQLRQASVFAVVLVVLLAIALPFLTAGMNSLVYSVGNLLGVNEEPTSPEEIDGHLDDLVEGTTQAAAGAAAAAAIEVPGGESSADEGVAAAAVSASIAAERAEQAAHDLQRAVLPDAEVPTGPARPPIPIDEDSAAARACPADTFDLPARATIDEERLASTARRACIAAQAAAQATAAVAVSADELAARGAIDPEDAQTIADAADTAVAGATTAAAAADDVANDVEGSSVPGVAAPKFFAALTALVTVINALRAKRRSDLGQGPSGDKQAKKGGSNRIANALGFGGLSEIIAGVVTALVLLIFFSDLVVDAWRRGPNGNMKMLFATMPASDWWVLAVAVLVVVIVLVNVNRWSWRTFYHRRLWLPYAVTPRGHTAAWRTDTRLSVVGKKVDGFPEVLICGAAQTSGREWAPPGRRAVSYVMSAEMCGGPEVGYVETATLEAMLGPRHRDAVTLFGAVTSSGAAFGPAMGRHSMGGMGAPMAIANARLGAWLPNPHHLAELAAARRGYERLRSGAVSRKPRLWYWLMEIIGQYPMDAKMVLVTDGGHIENLGLVELLRRRCNRIFCFDASGAGATPTTLAEAIFLAREELGVEVTLRPPLPGEVPEPPSDEPDPDAPPLPPELLALATSGADPLQRTLSDFKTLVDRLAKRPILVADIHYPAVTCGDRHANAFTGTLVYGTLALTDGGPDEWDLLEYAQRRGEFPDDGTVKQWFHSDVFSAYQQLGRLTARRMMQAAAEHGVTPPAV